MYIINGKVVDLDGKRESFIYQNKTYPSGTIIIYNGKCLLNNCEVTLNNQCVKWLYQQDGKHYFMYYTWIYTCASWELKDRIVKIVDKSTTQPKPNVQTQQQKTEIYWTDDMVAKTLWYIVIMLAATIFYDRVGIWILATIIWYNSTFKKK